jgi:ATP-dependent DNA helicase RecG
MVRAYVREHGEIRRQDVIELCRIGSDQAKRLLVRLVDEGVLAREGTGKSTRYMSGDRE